MWREYPGSDFHPLGVSGQVGNAFPDMALESLGLPLVSTMVKGGLGALGAGSKLAAPVADVATYAGYGGGGPGQPWGNDRKDILLNTAFGGAGGLAGHYLGAGLERGIIPKGDEAKTLLANGGPTPTYGQAMPMFQRTMEQGASHSSHVWLWRRHFHALDKSVKQFSRADVR